MANDAAHLQEQETAGQQGEVNLLDSIINDSNMVREESQKSWAKEIISEFAKEVMDGQIKVSKDTEAMINARIAELDRLISAQLNEIMHHDDFQKLESSWRGLNYLVQQSETGDRMKIKVLKLKR